MCCNAANSWTDLDNIRMSGKTAIVTGSNSGIGFWTALDLARRGCRVVLACRNTEKAEEAREQIISNTECDKGNVIAMHLNLSSFKSVRKFVDDFMAAEERLDVLVNNAGVMMCELSETEDGFETHFQVNHLSHFMLTNLLLDVLKKSAPSRIVVVSSILHEKGSIRWKDVNMRSSYSQAEAYYQSKLMNVLFARHMAKLLEGTNVSIFAVHPGYVKTNITRHILSPSGNLHWKFNLWVSYLPIMNKLVWISAEKGARAPVFCAIAPGIEHTSGGYYSELNLARPSSSGRSDRKAKRLWDLSMDFTS